jgi:hypothetical protein
MMLNIEPNQVCTGFVRYEDGAEYEGDICDALPHGSGLLKKEGHEYAGQFFYGKPQGHGIWTLPNGKTKHGEWQFGKFKILGDDDEHS